MKVENLEISSSIRSDVYRSDKFLKLNQVNYKLKDADIFFLLNIDINKIICIMHYLKENSIHLTLLFQIRIIFLLSVNRHSTLYEIHQNMATMHFQMPNLVSNKNKPEM